jgi:hypothetical protein
MTESLAFPAPEAGDPEDVAWNLQTGGTMWARGDQHEAVRWLRRAAEAASDAGTDLRAVALARAAADLTAALALPASIPPPPVSAPPSTETAPVPVSVRPAPPPVSAPTADEATTPRPMPVSRPKAPPLSPPDEATVHDYSIPADVEARERQQPPPSRRPPPPSRSSPSAAPPPPPSRSSPSGAPPPSSALPSSPLSSSPNTSRSSPISSSGAVVFRPRQALRVAVTPQGDDKTLMMVRALADDEPVPPGAHEALLTAMEAGVHLTSKKR